MLANADLIPSYDMLGSPMPPVLGQFLMALTLAAHWAFLAMTFGGAVAYMLGGRGDSEIIGEVRKKLAAFLPFGLSMAMTLGIGPLLFVQVLYGNFFYTANILMGYVWLGLLVLMIANLYLLFIAVRRIKRGRSVRLIGGLVLVFMALSAFILASNGTLAQNPQDWESFRQNPGTIPYQGDPTILPRWLFALSALLCGGGLFVALFMRIGLAIDSGSWRKAVGRPLIASAAGGLGVLVFGFWGGLALPKAMRANLLGSFESVFAYVAILGFVVASALAYSSLKSLSLRTMLLSAGALFVGLFSTAALRDTLRRIALGEYVNLGQVPVHSQWSSFVLFAVILVLGLALVGYLVKLSYGTEWIGALSAAAPREIQGPDEVL